MHAYASSAHLPHTLLYRGGLGMKNFKQFKETFCRKLTAMGEPLPYIPLAEILGQGRVLIEYHQGVAAYSEKSIVVQVSFGYIEIQGEQLELLRMSGSQLIISGSIHCLKLTSKEDATC